MNGTCTPKINFSAGETAAHERRRPRKNFSEKGRLEVASVFLIQKNPFPNHLVRALSGMVATRKGASATRSSSYSAPKSSPTPPAAPPMEDIW